MMCLQETIGDCYMVADGLIFTDAQGFKTVLQSQVQEHGQHAPAQHISTHSAACIAHSSTLRRSTVLS
jgi:hypothetical protein